MRIARYTTGEDPAYGVVEGEPGNEVVLALQGDPLYIGLVPGDGEIPLEEVRLLAPVIPRSKVIGIGRNYADHAREMGNEVPAEPLMFLIPNTAVVGPGDPVVLPRQSTNVHYEGELAVVIGKIAKDVRVEDALDCVWATPSPTTSRRATCRRATDSGRGPRGSTRSARWGRGWRPSSTLRTCASSPGSTARWSRTARRPTWSTRSPTSSPTPPPPSPSCPGTSSSPGRRAVSDRSTAGQRVSIEIEGIGTLDNPFVRR